MKRLWVLVPIVLAALGCCAQTGGYIHGGGAPTSGTSCAGSRFYIDDSTQQMYVASSGSPCSWNLSGAGSCVTTVANLSTACGATKGTQASVTDGANGSDCGTGGGTSVVACIYDGSSWAYAGATGGSMVYPGAGIGVSTGSAWGTSKASPTGTIVGTSDTQTLTNKTVDAVTPTTMGFLDATSSIQSQLNAKQVTVTLTTTGTSGAATFNASTGALNVPQYASGGGGGITNSAGNNVVMKSDGTNAIASKFTDDGTTGAYTGTGGLQLSGSTAINPSSAASGSLGSATLPFQYLFFAGTSGTPGTNNFKLIGASTSGTRTTTFPDSNTLIPIISQTLTISGPTASRTITVPDANFTAARTDAGNTFTGHQTIEGVTATGATGTGNMVYSAGPTFSGTATAANFTVTGTCTGCGGSGSPASYFHWGYADTNGAALTNNKCSAIYGFKTPPEGVQFGYLAPVIANVDPTNQADFVIFDGSGNAISHTGAQTWTTAGIMVFAVNTTGVTCSSSPCTLTGNTRYYQGFCTTSGSGVQESVGYVNDNADICGGVSSGNAPTSNTTPASLTLPSKTFIACRPPDFVLMTEP